MLFGFCNVLLASSDMEQCVMFVVFQILLPPKYEDVAGPETVASFYTPPPSYTDATGHTN